MEEHSYIEIFAKKLTIAFLIIIPIWIAIEWASQLIAGKGIWPFTPSNSSLSQILILFVVPLVWAYSAGNTFKTRYAQIVYNDAEDFIRCASNALFELGFEADGQDGWTYYYRPAKKAISSVSLLGGRRKAGLLLGRIRIVLKQGIAWFTGPNYFIDRSHEAIFKQMAAPEPETLSSETSDSQ